MNARTAMISITGFLILILIAVAMSAVGTGGKTAARRIAHEQATDTIEYLRAYDYRTLSIGFDSMAVTCQYGEILLPDQDSLAIRYTEYFEDEHGVNDSIAGINAVARTYPFAVNGPTQLSVWRSLYIQRPDSAVPYILPNNCAWTLRVHDASTGAWLATLDSTGFVSGRGESVTDFPSCFGLINEDSLSGEMLLYDVNAFIPEGVDSVYLTFAMHNLGGAAATGNILDFTLLDMKESTAILEAFMSKQPSGGRPSHTVTMTVFPNPVSSKGRYSLILETSRRFEVSLFSLDGGLIRRFFEGEKPGGVHVLPLDATGIASGAYMLVCRDGAGKTLASKTVHIQR